MENQTQATERERNVSNQQLMVTWQNRCNKIDEIGILCGDKTWELCEKKASSLSIYILGQRVLEFSKANIRVSS